MERYRGEITVFLSLLMSVLLLGVGALTELARATVIKSQIVVDANNALCSALAEYNKPMLDAYNIFVLDGAYGQKNINTKELSDRMKEYMAGANGQVPGLIRYGIKSLEVNELSFATDNCGQDIYNQIIDYMKKQYLLDIAENVTHLEESIQDFKQKSQEKEAREESSISEDITSKIGFFESISNLLKSNKMGQVLDLIPASNRTIDSSRLSVRRNDLFAGKSLRSPRISDKYLFNQYILDNFKYCIMREGNNENQESFARDSVLQYEVEYILAGKNKDSDNLAEVIDRLVLFREIFNLAYIETDSARVSEASSMATGLLAITGSPEIIEAGKHIILAAWAHAEAICDVRSLLVGYKVPLNKSQSNWHTQMSAIIFPRNTGTYEADSGMRYKDYLNILMLMDNEANLSIRTMDLMEQNIRLKDSYKNFALDNCLVGFGIRGEYDMKHIFASIRNTGYRYEGDISYEKLKN